MRIRSSVFIEEKWPGDQWEDNRECADSRGTITASARAANVCLCSAQLTSTNKHSDRTAPALLRTHAFRGDRAGVYISAHSRLHSLAQVHLLWDINKQVLMRKVNGREVCTSWDFHDKFIIFMHPHVHTHTDHARAQPHRSTSQGQYSHVNTRSHVYAQMHINFHIPNTSVHVNKPKAQTYPLYPFLSSVPRWEKTTKLPQDDLPQEATTIKPKI